MLPGPARGSPRRGVGAALLRACAGHGRSPGRELGSVAVDGRDERSLAFAGRFGYEEVDHEIEQVRELGVEPLPAVPVGSELVSVAEQPDRLEAAYPVAPGYADLPLPAPIELALEERLLDEATLSEGSFVALEDGQVVGYAGLLERAEPGTALTGSRSSAATAGEPDLRPCSSAPRSAEPRRIGSTSS